MIPIAIDRWKNICFGLFGANESVVNFSIRHYKRAFKYFLFPEGMFEYFRVNILVGMKTVHVDAVKSQIHNLLSLRIGEICNSNKIEPGQSMLTGQLPPLLKK